MVINAKRRTDKAHSALFILYRHIFIFTYIYFLGVLFFWLMSRCTRNPTQCHMRKTSDRTRFRIRAVWSLIFFSKIHDYKCDSITRYASSRFYCTTAHTFYYFFHEIIIHCEKILWCVYKMCPPDIGKRMLM